MNGITYMVVEPDGRIEVHSGVLDEKVAQSILASEFEVMPSPDDIPVTVLASTEGKTRGDDPNWGITSLIHRHLRSGDFVAGKVIVTGAPDSDGNLTSLTVKDEQAVRSRIKPDD